MLGLSKHEPVDALALAGASFDTLRTRWTLTTLPHAELVEA
jgi:hypothetical protein